MAQFENMRKVDLANGEPAVFSLRQLYYADIEANRIGAIVLMNGEPFPLSGTCTGTAIRADGATVPMTGTVEGNQAYIILTADCYAVEGDIQVFVKLTTGTVTATLAAARGTVRLTETGAVIDPGEIIPSVSALITAINDAVESIPADYSALLAAIAPAYADLTIPVKKGTFCWHSGSLYTAKQDIDTSESWTASHWDSAPLANELAGRVDALKSALHINIYQTNGEPVTGERGTEGSVYVECYFMEGHTYVLENTSDTSAIVAGTQNIQGTTIDSITSGLANGAKKSFTATADAKYIWVYGNGAFSFSIVESSSVGYYVDNTVVPMVERAIDRIDDLQYDAIIESASSGYVYIDYDFKSGGKYELRNLYSGSVVAATTNEKTSSATAVDSITSGATGNAIFAFTATGNASVLRLYFTAINGKVSIRKIDTPVYYVDSTKDSYAQITRQQTYTIKSNGFLYYPMISGKKYRVRNITVPSDSGNYGIQLYTRQEVTGSNVETVTSGLSPMESVVFSASNSTKYLYATVGGGGNITFTVDEVGTVLDAFEQDRKKPYTSGQIHFTVPVNQKRLYNTQGSGTTAQDDETNIVNVNCVCMLPSTYTEHGGKTKLLMICHGSGGGVTSTTWFRDDETILAFFQQFLNAGYAIFDCNGYTNGSSGQESFGVDTAIIAYHAAYQYMIKNYNVEDQLNIYGFSMGGLTALNYVNMFPGGIKCLALGSPLVSIYKTVWVDYTVQAKGDVAAAYGFANATDYEADTVGNCDPYARIKTIGGTALCFDPLPTTKIWHGTSDTATQPAYSEDYSDAVNAAGRYCYYRPVSGKGHEICYGGNAVVTGEIIAFLNRYN